MLYLFSIAFSGKKLLFWRIRHFVKKKKIKFFYKVLFQSFNRTAQFTQKTLIILENVQISVVAICEEVLLVAAFYDWRIAKSLSVGNHPRFSFLLAVFSEKHYFRSIRQIVKKQKFIFLLIWFFLTVLPNYGASTKLYKKVF